MSHQRHGRLRPGPAAGKLVPIRGWWGAFVGPVSLPEAKPSAPTRLRCRWPPARKGSAGRRDDPSRPMITKLRSVNLGTQVCSKSFCGAWPRPLRRRTQSIHPLPMSVSPSIPGIAGRALRLHLERNFIAARAATATVAGRPADGRDRLPLEKQEFTGGDPQHEAGMG